jgi:hypothetical protein
MHKILYLFIYIKFIKIRLLFLKIVLYKNK